MDIIHYTYNINVYKHTRIYIYIYINSYSHAYQYYVVHTYIIKYNIQTNACINTLIVNKST